MGKESRLFIFPSFILQWWTNGHVWTLDTTTIFSLLFHRQLYYFFLVGGSPPSIREMRREAIKTLIAPLAALCCGDRVRISFFISQTSFLEGDKWIPVSAGVHCSAVVVFFCCLIFFSFGGNRKLCVPSFPFFFCDRKLSVMVRAKRKERLLIKI